MRTIKKILNKIIFIIVLAALCNDSLAKTIYVDDDAVGNNDGTSWVDSYQFLQNALVDAFYADKPVEIRVAQGTYTPDCNSLIPEGTGNQYSTFRLINSISLIGGYAGLFAIDPNTDPNTRDFVLYKTTLSGDLSENDDPIFWANTNGDNSFHILTLNNAKLSVVIDGFTIMGGRCDYYYKNGGGLRNINSDPTIRNCTFTHNEATNGAGIYNEESNPTLINCTFHNNLSFISAGNPDGYTGGGAGMYNHRSHPNLIDCTFYDNLVYITNLSSNNKPHNLGGAGMYNFESSATLTNCIFKNNRTGGDGGSIYDFGSILELIGCEFSGNNSNNGGAICSYSGWLILTNCLFSGNKAKNNGGGIYTKGRSIEVTMTNCTFFKNSAKPGNGNSFSYDLYYGSQYIKGIKISNCIIWEDMIAIEIPESATIDIKYTNIRHGQFGIMRPNDQSSGGGKTILSNNIDEDALFANPGYWADINDPNLIVYPDDPNAVWIEGDYHLKSQSGRYDQNGGNWVFDDVTSPCIDAGDPSSTVTEEPFYNGGRINMGAYGGTPEASKSYLDESLIVDVNENDAGGQVVLDQGQILVVTLESNPSTGYRWELAEDPNSILEQIGEVEFAPSNEPPIVGEGGREIFRFKPVRAGQETLTLVYRRSWEKGAEPLKKFSFEVTVN